MTIPSQFIHLDHFYNWGDLALPVEMIISLYRGMSHLVTPCVIRTACMSLCQSTTFVGQEENMF